MGNNSPNKLISFIVAFLGDEDSKAKYLIEEFDSLSTEEKIKDFAWYTPYIGIAIRGWPFTPCFAISHFFANQNPTPGTPCNCRRFTYRKDGYCQRVIEEEYNPLTYA